MKPSYPVGLHTLKASVITDDRYRVEQLVEDMVAAGKITQIKKHRYIKAGA